MVLGLQFNKSHSLGLVKSLTQAGSLMQSGISLNQLPRTFVRATSAYDPIGNKIVAPGVARQRTLSVSGTSGPMDLIEPATTNLLAAGSSDDFTNAAWASNGITVTPAAVAAPDGSMTGQKLLVGLAGGARSVSQVITTSAAIYTASFYLMGSSTSTQATFGLYNAGFLSITAQIVSGPGVVNSGSNTPLYVTGLSTTQWTRIAITLVGNAPATTTSFALYPDGVGGVLNNYVYAIWTQFEQSATPTSYVSNRNLVKQSAALTAAPWGNNGSSATIVTNTDVLPSGNTAFTVTVTGINDCIIQANIPVVASTSVTLSWWAKLGTSPRADWIIYDATHAAVIQTANYTSSINSSTYTRVYVTVAIPVGCTAIHIYPLYRQAVYSGSVKMGDVQLEYGTTPTALWCNTSTIGGRDIDNLSVSLASISDPRTNLLLYSEQFDKAANWNTAGATVAANNAVDPNGNMYADTFTAGTGICAQDITVTPGQQYVFWFWAKRGTSTAHSTGIYDLTHGAFIVASSSYASQTSTSSWARIVVQFTAPVGCVSARCYTWSGGDAGTIQFWGASCIAAISDPGQGSYLPTAGTAVTSAQTGLSTTSGTLVNFFIPYGWSGDPGVTVDGAQNGAPFEFVQYTASGPNATYFNRGDSGGARSSYLPIGYTLANGVLTQFAGTWNPSQVAVYKNGVAGTPATTLAAPFATTSTAYIGQTSTNIQQAKGWSCLLYFDQRVLVTDEQKALFNSAAA